MKYELLDIAVRHSKTSTSPLDLPRMSRVVLKGSVVVPMTP